jgi:transcriptional regulator with XRE-family HTH domain
MTDRQKMGERLRQLRVIARLTQEQMAKRLGVSQPTLHKMERGEADIPVSALVGLWLCQRNVEYLMLQSDTPDMADIGAWGRRNE